MYDILKYFLTKIFILNLSLTQSNIRITSRFENQLAVDQESCIHPDYKSPFQGKEDAVKRLIR